LKNIKRVGAAKVSRLTFLLVVLLAIIILLAKSCFIDSNMQDLDDEKSPYSLNTTNTTIEGRINVDLERYYYDLGLLPPTEMPQIYQPIKSISVEDNLSEVNLSDVYLDDEKESLNLFDDIELNIALDEIPQNVEKTVPEDNDLESQIDNDQKNLDDENTELSQLDENEDLFIDDEFDQDWEGGFVDDLSTPFEPFLFDPIVQTQEEYDLFNPKELQTKEITDDFFDDFYIAGESDQSLFDDGIYYLSLFVNGDRVGDVETKIEGDVYSIGVQSLYSNISNILSESGIQRLFNDSAPEYYTIDELNKLNVETTIDVVAFEVYMEFGVDDIPIKYLPINTIEKNTLISRNEKYGISDATILDPSFFSFVSSLNLTSSYTYGSAINEKTLNTSLNMSNSLSIGKVYFDFANSFQYSLSSSTNSFEYNISTWNGYFDLRDKNLRITFGNVGSYLGTEGTPVGFTLEKNYSYGTGEPLPHQFTKRYLIETESNLYVYINDEEPVVKKLKKGDYILKDFPLSQGANHIRVKIEPIDKSYPIILDEFDMPYDSRLLSMGDYLYGFSAAISKSLRSTTSTSWFTLPYLDGNFYDYDFSDFDTRFYLNVGLTNTFTLNSSFAFSFDEIQSSFEGVLATMSGPFSSSLFTNFSKSYSPKVLFNLSHTFGTPIGDINSSISLALPVWENDTGALSSASELSLSLGHSIENDDFPPLSTTLSATINNNGIKWQSTFSSNYSPLPGLSLNGALNISNVSYTSEIDISLQIGMGFTLLNNLTASNSLSSTGASSLSVNYKPTDKDSLQFNIGGIQYLTATKPVYNLAWQHSDNYYTLLLRQNMANDLTIQNTTATISSALFFADGLFAINRSSASNFIILKPRGNYANNPISIGKTNSSNLNVLDTVFGNAVYTQLVGNSRNNLIAYGTSDSLYNSGSSFSFELNTNTRTGYAKTLDSPISYTVSGVLLQSNGSPFEQYSSPVYKLLVDENGVEYLEPDEQLYLFTDLDGRFILSEVKPGTYLFDMSNGQNQWYGLYFTIGEDIKSKKSVILLNTYKQEIQDEIANAFEVSPTDENADTVSTFGDQLASDYLDIIELSIEKYEDEETFWNTIFPPLDEGVDDFAFEDTAEDWQNNIGDSQQFDDQAFVDDPAFIDTADDWQSTLDDAQTPVLVVDNQNKNPNFTYVP